MTETERLDDLEKRVARLEGVTMSDGNFRVFMWTMGAITVAFLGFALTAVLSR